MDMLPTRTNVMIVGAGPTGLTLAAVLAMEGISFVLVDRMTRAATLRRPRARSMRNAAIRLVGAIPAVRRRIALELAEPRYR